MKRSGDGGDKVVYDGDFVDVLLDLESENKFSDSDMIAVLWVCHFYFICFFKYGISE